MKNASTLPATRGILVDRRCWSVDLLENLLTLGQQEAIFRSVLDTAQIEPGERLLDVGCGTGKLALMAARRITAAAGGEVHGLDATAGMIERARRRTGNALTNIQFHLGVAERLPFADHDFDIVTSTLLFHHLPDDLQHEALREVARVLRPGGRLVLADYAQPHGVWGYVASLPHRFNFYEYVRPQLHGSLERLLRKYLTSVDVAHRFLGYITVFKAMQIPAEASISTRC